ncbi:hypothetical protein M378DRAFT_160063 [Amanita muscaria Koide BX008]|uniref:Uncharacterized protein n=1 Tax=Amanita muscaria (strain Koide BX008) TaxID=946122 RepID=A0A0C2XCH4_AMAMK|nr:hypothetical protein M378DRAFT_160063 [Amanita muscaria Koide BX008]
MEASKTRVTRRRDIYAGPSFLGRQNRARIAVLAFRDQQLLKMGKRGEPGKVDITLALAYVKF